MANAGNIASTISEILDIYKDGNSKIEDCGSFGYVLPMYRTLQILDNFTKGKDTLPVLDGIIRNIPEIMTEDDIRDLIQRLGVH